MDNIKELILLDEIGDILNTNFLSMKERIELIRFIDAHDLTPEELNDNEYINTLIENFKENL